MTDMDHIFLKEVEVYNVSSGDGVDQNLAIKEDLVEDRILHYVGSNYIGS